MGAAFIGALLMLGAGGGGGHRGGLGELLAMLVTVALSLALVGAWICGVMLAAYELALLAGDINLLAVMLLATIVISLGLIGGAIRLGEYFLKPAATTAQPGDDCNA